MNSNKIEVALLSEVFPPSHGGSGRWFSEMYPLLRGVRTTYVVGTHPSAETYDSGRELDVRRWPLDLRFNGIEDFRQIRKHLSTTVRLRAFLKKGQFDQLHAGRPLSEGFVAALACPRGTKLVCYVHGEDVAVAKSSRQLTIVTNYMLRRCDYLVVNSNNSHRMLVDEWNVQPEKIKLLHPGVDVELFGAPQDRDAIRRDMGWEGRVVILTVGRLQQRKGQDTAIRATEQLRQKYPNLLWVIAGNGDDSERLQNLSQQRGVSDNVEFIHDFDDQKLAHLYAAADIFALPNRRVGRDVEGFGMVLLEAQSAGLPVIAGESGGTADAMSDGETGLLVDCSDPDQPENLVTTLSSLLSSPDTQRRMGEAGKRFAANFSWPNVAQRANLIFQQMNGSQEEPADLI